MSRRKKPSLKIAVCIASRGVGHVRSIASAIEEVAPYLHRFCWAFGQPIPQAQNSITEEALSDPDVTHLFFVEDDNLLPVGCLAAMLADDKPIVAIDYRTRSAGTLMALRHQQTGQVVLAPMGVLLVKREVFAAIPSPPFQVSTRKMWVNTAWKDTGVWESAGGQDVFFCTEALRAGYAVTVLDGWEAGHLETVSRGAHVNYGMDEERCWGGINLPWRPEERSKRMAAVYLKSPASGVMDIDPDHSPEAAKNLDTYRAAGWVEIGEDEFSALLEQQIARQEEVRQKWIENGGGAEFNEAAKGL